MLKGIATASDRPITRGIVLGALLLVLSASTVFPKISLIGKGSKEPELASTPSSSVAVTVRVVQAPEIPTVFFMDQNYPNPSSTATNIRYGLPKAAWTTVEIFDIRGAKVATLVNQHRDAGFYTVRWDAGRCGSGVYLCRISAGVFHATRKIVVVR